MVKSTVEDAIEFAEKHSSALYLFPPAPLKPRSVAPVRKTPRSKQKKTVVKKPILASGSSLVVSSSSTVSSSPAASSSTPTLTPFQQLNRVHGEINASFAALKKGGRGFAVADALGNAQSHLEDVLSVMYRMLQKPIAVMSRTEVQAFVVDAVRHTTLAVEQMISALDRETNDIKNHEQLKDRLTHNLYYSLLNCKFPAGVMEPRLRTWIYQASKGEIFVRNPSQCRLGTPSVQTLLAKMWMYVKGNDALSSQRVLHEVIQFCQNGIEVCQELQKQIQAAKGQKTIAVTSEALSALFQTLFDVVSAEATESDFHALMSSSSSSEDASQAILKSLSQHIDRLQQVLDPDGTQLQNVRMHLLPLLQEELQHVLSPVHARLHAGNVLLSNQMILEEVLEMLIDTCQPSYERDPDRPHDLKGMIAALGVDVSRLSQEELLFLNNGRAVRQLVRYPSSCRSPKIPFLQEIYSTMTTALPAGAFDLHFHEGFEMKGPAAPKKLSAMMLMVRRNLFLLESLLKKIVENQEWNL